MSIGAERLNYFKGVLNFGSHAIDDAADIPNAAQDFANEMATIFRKGTRNLALIEVADVPLGATNRHRAYYSQYPSHRSAFAARTLEYYRKKVNKKTIDQMLDIYARKNDPVTDFLLSYLRSLDILTKQGFRVAAIYEDNQISPIVITRQVQEYQHRYQSIATSEDFRSFFDDYVSDIITVRDIQFARTINEFARSAEITHNQTNLFGFLGLSHLKGVADRLESTVRSSTTVNKTSHAYTSVMISLQDSIKLRVANGDQISDQEWKNYYKDFISNQHS